MKWDLIAGNWKQFKGKVREQWGELTQEDITEVDGKYELLIDKLQKTYGYHKERAEKEVEDFIRCMESQDYHSKTG